MPLRGKKGQGYISVVVKADDPLDEAAGKATSRRVSAYFASAYYAAGASEGGGGRWCMALSTPAGHKLPEAAADNMLRRGVAPGQEWTQERLEALLRGEGRRLGTSTVVDQLTGESRKVQVAQTNTWVYDVPKSVSLLACYGYDDDGWLTSVVEDAARSAMEYLADQTAFVRRRGADGEIERQNGSAIHYSLVLERTARSAEGSAEGLTGLASPHYHAHVLIHGAYDRAGQYGAYDAWDALTSGHRQTASAMGDLIMRRRLADRGIELRRVQPEPDANADDAAAAPPRWEVASIPDAAILVASERRRAILAAVAEDPQASTSDLGAEYRTKADKVGVDDWPALLRTWRARIEDAGASAPDARRPPPGVPPGGVQAGVADGQTVTPSSVMLAAAMQRVHDRLAGTRSTFRLTELRAEVIQEIEGTWHRGLVGVLWDEVVARWAQSGTLIPLVGDVYCLERVRSQELRTLALWEQLSKDVSDDLTAHAPAAIKAGEEAMGYDLDFGQRRLVVEALRRRATIGAGVAGVGKTAAGDALRRAAEVAGRRMHSVAMACLRARDTGLAISATRDESVAAVMNALHKGGLPRNYARGDILLVDEVSQLSDVTLEGLLRATEQRDLHLVLLGDPSQQGSMGRGAIARWLIRQRGDAVVELRVAHRFHDPVQAEALVHMHDGNAWPWLRYAHERGWLRSFGEQRQADEELLRLWREDPERLVITMADNQRRDDLNALVVSELVARGEVSADQRVEVRADTKSQRRVDLHLGQLIRLNRQVVVETAGGRLEKLAKNGEVARLVDIAPAITPDQKIVRLRFDEGTKQERTLELETRHVVASGAYVLQAYKAQGSTAERVVVDWADGRRRQQAYPTLSRQRDEVVVVGVGRDESERVAGPSALADRIAETIKREEVPSPAAITALPEEWPDPVALTAHRREVELAPSPLLVARPERVVESKPAGPDQVERVVPDRVLELEGELTARGVDLKRVGSVIGPVTEPATTEVERTPALLDVEAAWEPAVPVIRQALDQERIAAAMRGELTLDQLTLEELTEALAQRSIAEQLRRGEDLDRIEVRRERGAEPEVRSAPAAPYQAVPRGIVRDQEPDGPRLVISRGEPQPVRPWEPERAQLPDLERAQGAWPAVLDRKAAILEMAVQQLPQDLAEADREARLDSYREQFLGELASTWEAAATAHRVTGSPLPELDREVLARHGIADLVLPEERRSEVVEPAPELERVQPSVDQVVDVERAAAEATREVETDEPEVSASAEAVEPGMELERDEVDVDVERVRDDLEEPAAVLEPSPQAPPVAEPEPEPQLDEVAEVAEEPEALGPEWAYDQWAEPAVEPEPLAEPEAPIETREAEVMVDTPEPAAEIETQRAQERELEAEREVEAAEAERERAAEVEREAELEREHQAELEREDEIEDEIEAEEEREASYRRGLEETERNLELEREELERDEPERDDPSMDMEY
jgi:hypothetical protein